MSDDLIIKEFEEKLLIFFEEFKRSKKWLAPKIAAKFCSDQVIILRHLHKKYKSPLGLEYIKEDLAEEQRQIAAEIDSQNVIATTENIPEKENNPENKSQPSIEEEVVASKSKSKSKKKVKAQKEADPFADG